MNDRLFERRSGNNTRYHSRSLAFMQVYVRFCILCRIVVTTSIWLYKNIGPLPDYPQTTVDKVASVIELDFVYLIDCVSVGKYYHFSPHPPLSPLVLNSKKFAVMNPK